MRVLEGGARMNVEERVATRSAAFMGRTVPVGLSAGFGDRSKMLLTTAVAETIDTTSGGLAAARGTRRTRTEKRPSA